jgi:DNA-binding MarR family transcriptional regulator
MSRATEAAAAFAELFPAVYLRFHRRDDKRSELTAAARAVLQHLSIAGPLTVSEMARHLDRAQSVVSEIVDGLCRHGWLERARDPADRRRALLWLTDAGVELLSRDRDVLSRALLERAMAAMTDADRTALLVGMRALVEADRRAPPRPPGPTHALRKPKRVERRPASPAGAHRGRPGTLRGFQIPTEEKES